MERVFVRVMGACFWENKGSRCLRVREASV